LLNILANNKNWKKKANKMKRLILLTLPLLTLISCEQNNLTGSGPLEPIELSFHEADLSAAKGTIKKIRLKTTQINGNVWMFSSGLNLDLQVLNPIGATTDSTIAEKWGEPDFKLRNDELFLFSIGVNDSSPDNSALVGQGPILVLIFEVIGAPGSTTPLKWSNPEYNEGAVVLTARDAIFTVTEG
jgi:hypothetical protein